MECYNKVLQIQNLNILQPTLCVFLHVRTYIYVHNNYFVLHKLVSIGIRM